MKYHIWFEDAAISGFISNCGSEESLQTIASAPLTSHRIRAATEMSLQDAMALRGMLNEQGRATIIAPLE